MPSQSEHGRAPHFDNNPPMAQQILVNNHNNSDSSSTEAGDRGEKSVDPLADVANRKIAAELEKPGTHDKVELQESMCYDELGFSYTPRKKWTILTIIFLVQTSMNFNSSLYSNAVTGISTEYGVSAQAARIGAAIFLVTYAFGCELWARKFSSSVKRSVWLARDALQDCLG